MIFTSNLDEPLNLTYTLRIHNAEFLYFVQLRVFIAGIVNVCIFSR